MSVNFDNMIGKKLCSVELAADKSKIVFKFIDGSVRAFGVEGDCCSQAWIEHLEMPHNIGEATLLSVEQLSSDRTGDDLFNPKVVGGYCEDQREHESLEVYQTKFKTDSGEIVLEFRNSSNGYYGGYLVDVKE